MPMSKPSATRSASGRACAQAGLSDEQAADWLARLTLILCNHIGDGEAPRHAFALAHHDDHEHHD